MRQDLEGRGLTKAGVAVVVGSLVILIVAIPIFFLTRNVASMGFMIGPARVASSASPAVEFDFKRVGKDLRVKVKIENHGTVDMHGASLQKLSFDTVPVRGLPVHLGNLVGGSAIMRTFVLKGVRSGARKHEVHLAWTNAGGGRGSLAGSWTEKMP
ncbi:MAG: hypothetical protein ACAH95_00130 [Fimbriimonas sp.]